MSHATRRTVWSLVFLAAACSSETTVVGVGGGDGDASVIDEDGGRATGDAASDGAAPRDDAGTNTDSAAPLDAMTLAGSFGGKTYPFEHGAYGVTASGDGGASTLHVEAYYGGAPGCPTNTSPNTDRTLVLAPLRTPAVGVTQTMADGVRATLFDFKGDITLSPALKATRVAVTPRAVTSDALSLDVDTDMGDGGVRGVLYAVHCASLDQ